MCALPACLTTDSPPHAWCLSHPHLLQHWPGWFLGVGKGLQQRSPEAGSERAASHRRRSTLSAQPLNEARRQSPPPGAPDIRCTTDVIAVPLAMQLMRMISCRRSGFLQRSGMLPRCVHLLRHITHLVGMTVLRLLQLLPELPVRCCCHMPLKEALQPLPGHAPQPPVSRRCVLTAMFDADTGGAEAISRAGAPAPCCQAAPASHAIVSSGRGRDPSNRLPGVLLATRAVTRCALRVRIPQLLHRQPEERAMQAPGDDVHYTSKQPW